MNYPTITNWKDVVDQFGIDKARYLSKKLREHKSEMTLIEYSPETTDAVAIFEYKGFIDNCHVFEYTGTAN